MAGVETIGAGPIARLGASEPLYYPDTDGGASGEPTFIRYTERPFIPESPENQLLQGKVALITGVGDQRGLGPAMAWEFARHGASVVMTATERSRSDGEDLAGVLQNHGVVAEWHAHDLRQESARTSILEQVTSTDTFGRIDILVANAGMRDDGLLMSVPEDTLREVMEVNVIAPFLLIRDTVNKMRRQKPRGGAVLLTSSLAKEGNPGQAVYSLTKGALYSLGMTGAKELGGSGIRFNVLVPGLVPGTKMTEGLSTRDKDRLLAAIGTDNPAESEQVARAAVLAASERHGMNGAALIISGQETYNYADFPVPQE